MNDGHPVTRRGVFRIGGVLGLGMVGGCVGPGGGGEIPMGPLPVGNVNDLAVGALRVVDFVAVGRDQGGVYALSTICTHAGCPTQTSGVSASELFCPCHGSIFDRNGAVIRGPARSALPHFQVDLAADGSMVVQQDAVVVSSARTAVSPTGG